MRNDKDKSAKQIISEIIEIAETGGDYERYSRIFDVFIIVLIILNVLAVVLSSIDSFFESYNKYLYYFELVSVIIFSLEYLLRLITCTELDKFENYKKNKGRLWLHFKVRLLYILSPMAMIDLLAVLPFYLPMFISFDLRFIRIFRLFRILRLLKASRYSKSIRTLGKVVMQKKMELLTTLFVMILLIVAASSFMYYLENPVQPEIFPSIPATMWWGVATLTTVGYGDVYPITIWGKFFAGLIAVLGIGIVALPSGILASGLIEEFQNLKEGYMSRGSTKNHILICGWNYLCTDILDKLSSNDAKKAGIDQIIIMANIDKPQLELMKYEKNENIYYIKADPQVEANLIDKGYIDKCRSVIILPDFGSTKSDAVSLMILLAIKKRATEIKKEIFTCIQVLDSKYKEHFLKAKADEIVCLDDFGSGIAVGSIITNGLTKVVNELVDYNEGSEIYKSEKIDEKYVGKRFKELAKIFLEENIILIAIETSDNKTIVNPNKDHLVQKGDKLFFIAENKEKVDNLFAEK